MVDLKETYVKILVSDLRRAPSEVLRTALFDETTKFAFSLYPKIAFVPTHVYKALDYYERNTWSHKLEIVALTGKEPHLKHWKDLTNVDINLGIERLRYERRLKEPSPYSVDLPREKKYITNPLMIDT